MGRRDFLFKWLFYALTALGFVLVQVFGLVHIRIWGVHPFLFPVLVSTVAALESAHESAVFALATGAVLDVTMPGVIPCFYTVAFLVVFLLAWVLSAKVLSQPFFCCMLCGVLSIVCTDLLQMLFLNPSEGFDEGAAEGAAADAAPNAADLPAGQQDPALLPPGIRGPVSAGKEALSL